VEEGGIHHEVLSTYHASLNKPVHRLIEDPLEDLSGTVVLEPAESGLVWNPLPKPQSIPPPRMLG